MAFSVNKVILLGNLGNDPEIRSTGNGNKVAEFSLATSRRWTDRNGQVQEKTEWHRVIAWDSERGAKLADIVERFLRKGDKAYVEGEIQYRSYEAKEGGTRYTTEINAREIVTFGGREGAPGSGDGGGERSRRPSTAESGGSRAPSRPGGSGTKESSYNDYPTKFPDGGDDDLPF
ncbi:MAG: single-stranded DNA-binding protein [Gemmatimonadota bacterium]|nr:single-stranded DNA-binding protein [Gemmatimonadota bacterium]